jgi:hypothetical protein
LRSALAAHEAGRGKRYAPELRAQVVVFAESRRNDGASWAEIASELSLHLGTLLRWSKATEMQPSRALLPVRVVPDAGERTVSIVSASGFRIEGLTLREAIDALRALG